MNNRLRTSLATLLAASLLVAAACSEAKDAVTNVNQETTTAPTAMATPSPSPTPLPYIAPLTGLGLEQEAKSRPLAVMINNFSAARPQSGLSQADVLWEVLAEGGITRLVAIFQSADTMTDTIGPIRSNRKYLIGIADSYGAIMAHAGGSPEAYGILQKQGKPYLDEITNAGSYFWRSKDRKAPHNLYSTQEKLREGAAKKKYDENVPVPVYKFSPNGSIMEQAGTTEARDITINFLMDNYKVGYQYDETSGLYKRSINGEPHIDLNNNETLSAANLIVFETGHKTLDNVGRLSVDLESGGEAYLFQKGKKMDIDWVSAPDGMIRFATKDGAEIALVPGHTFIHVVPNKPALAEHVEWVQSGRAG
ncbi:DUF3048 domain-containing protein [Paenibacillus sp. LHD-117]|uniref:DUF3048 domain-containing protein n=1 Tax=Paenibacillus sp. LHD-117 TaxID=3071412 RepID=UPI0027DF573C|nr:DUF3048 domain-containing protein [Paenibacillus sp. LHD-117]MDQ6422530.1 DUF3048 domain-containing protein [Paenibacillus sp. LHD-117]